MRGAEGQETRTLYFLSESMIPEPDLEGVLFMAPGIAPSYPEEQLILVEYEGVHTAKSTSGLQRKRHTENSLQID